MTNLDYSKRVKKAEEVGTGGRGRSVKSLSEDQRSPGESSRGSGAGT